MVELNGSLNRNELGSILKEFDSLLILSPPNDFCTLLHISKLSRPEGNTISHGVIAGAFNIITRFPNVRSCYTECPFDIGRDVPEVGGGKGTHKLPFSWSLVRIHFVFEEHGGVAFVISRNEAVRVVHGGGVDGEPVDGTQGLSCGRLHTEEDHALVNIVGIPARVSQYIRNDYRCNF